MSQVRNKINQYTCDECGGVITTVDIDEGTTPMFLGCRATEECFGRMQSSMYRCDQSQPPTHEWFKPTGKVKRSLRQHVAMGGLLIRRVGAKS